MKHICSLSIFLYVGSDLNEYFPLIISSVVGSIFRGAAEKTRYIDANNIHCCGIIAWKSTNTNPIMSLKPSTGL